MLRISILLIIFWESYVVCFLFLLVGLVFIKMLNFLLSFCVYRSMVVSIFDCRFVGKLFSRFIVFFNEFVKVMFWKLRLFSIFFRNVVKCLLGLGRFLRYFIFVIVFLISEIDTGRMRSLRCIWRFTLFRIENKLVRNGDIGFLL